MTDQRWIRMWDIYHEALSRSDPAGRRDYLEMACAGDQELRHEIDELLTASLDETFHGALDSPETTLADLLNEESDQHEVEPPAETEVERASESSTSGSALHPERVGGYRIDRILGEGGMGVVYEAEQEFPRRLVAIKMIRPGFVTEAVTRRFKREIEVLGRLRHPGIVQIYNAGIHDAKIGEASMRVPWFAMERVEGRPITDYVDENNFSIHDRVELLNELCEIVQYAHDRGVIHRDLKPANILIDEHDHPRILDFGIARAIESGEHESTHLHTMTGEAIMGTMAYMSPEQLHGENQQIDVRADVYSLGVIGYELLTGRLPHDVRSMSIADAIRAITESDPTPPSRIVPEISRELDLILSKALQRSTDDRYRSIEALSADLGRYLRGEPVQTRGVPILRQTWRLLRRHRALSIGAAACVAAIILAQIGGVLAALLALAVGLVGTAAGLLRATHARVQAEQFAALAEVQAEKARRIQGFMTEMLTSLDPREAQGEELRVRDLLDKAARRASEEFIGQPDIEASLCETIGKTYLTIGCYDEAQELITHAHAIRVNVDHGESPASAANLHYQGLVAYHQGRYDDARALMEQSIRTFGRLGIESSFDLAVTHRDLGIVFMRKGNWEDSERQYDFGIDMMKSLDSVEPKELAAAMSGKAVLYRTNHRFNDARDVYLEILEILDREGLQETIDYAVLMNNLGVLHSVQQDHRQSEAYFRDALSIRRRLLPPQHPEIASVLNNLAGSLRMQRRNDEAEPLYRESLEIRRAILPPDHPDVAMTLIGFGYSRVEAGAPKEAEGMFREAVEIRRKSLPADHPRVANAAASLAFCLYKLERYDEAHEILEPAVNALEREWTLADDRVQKAMARLADIYEKKEDMTKAEKLRDRLREVGAEVVYDRD